MVKQAGRQAAADQRAPRGSTPPPTPPPPHPHLHILGAAQLGQHGAALGLATALNQQVGGLWQDEAAQEEHGGGHAGQAQGPRGPGRGGEGREEAGG